MQGDLLDWTPPDGHRDGETYEPRLDYDRLNRQQKGVYDVIADFDWWALGDIAELTGFPEASVSARLRDFRKEKFGGLIIERMRRGDGLHLYRLRPHD